MLSKLDRVHEIKVKPDSGKNTRLQSYQKMVKGMPDIKPAKPKVTKTNGDKLRVSGTHNVSINDIGDGVIKGADGRSFYHVTDDPLNGEAAKLYVKQSDIEVVKTGGVYTVKSGDSLVKIAKKLISNNGEVVNMIYEANKDVIGSNADLIRPGQKLFIPYQTH